MPFIDDQELDSLQSQIDNSLKEKEVVEDQYDELLGKYSDHKKRSFITNLIFGIVAGITSAISLFLFFNPVGGEGNQQLAENTENVSSQSDTDDETEEEAAEGDEETTDDNEDGGEEAKGDGGEGSSESSTSSSANSIAESVKSKISGKTVYSVQIKAFNNDQFPVISTAIAAMAEHKEGYFKYTIGLYDTLEGAQNLRNVLIRLGFRDAFVASYIDGVRQRIHLPE